MLSAATHAIAQDLVPSPNLAPDIAALPRLNGDGAVVSDINARLQHLDDHDLENLNCNGQSPPDGPFRAVEVLADGPEFLSFMIDIGAYCDGAAHPSWSREIVNLDLQTGEETGLREFLPPSGRPSQRRDDLLTVFFLNSVADLPGDCVQAYAWALSNGYLHLDLGLDEAEGALLLWPSGLAYVETPCLDTAYVPVDRLREAGFGERLTRALTPPN